MAEVTVPTVPTVPPLATLSNVELIHTGTWSISTGDWVVTVEDLASAVAALECPAVRRPILKLGHTLPLGEPNPGEPAVGWIGNLAVAESGRTLVGDYMGMPGWLGEVLASAYPDRSVESQYDYRCQLGHTHPFVVHAVALLGLERPGVGTLQSLQDVAELYGVAAGQAPAGASVTFTVSANAQEVAAVTHPRPFRQVAAGITTEDVRRAYYAGPGDSWDQWIESMELEPLQLIVMDDAKGKRYRVPVTIGDGDGEDAVSFDDPVEVVIRYEDAAVAAATPPGRITWTSRAESRPGTPPKPPAPSPGTKNPTAASAAAGTKKGAGMDPAKMREALDLAADASDDEVRAAIATAGLVGEPPADAPPNDLSNPAPPAARSVSADAVVLDPAQYTALRQQAMRGEDAWRKLRENECETVLDAAIKAGKFPPARRDHWKTLWAADPDGTMDLISRLAANVIPISETGYPGVGDETETDMVYAAMYPSSRVGGGRG